MDCFGSLLERPLIHADFEHKYPILLKMFERELDQAKVIFDVQMEASGDQKTPPINKNMPHVAGALKWSNELNDRITKPMHALKLSLNHG